MYRSTSSIGVLFLLVCLLSATGVRAQQAKGGPLAVHEKRTAGSFPLVGGRRAAGLCVDSGDAPVVRIAARALRDDVQRVTGAVPAIDSAGRLPELVILIGTIGRNKQLDQLIKAGKLDLSGLKNKWETYGLFVIDRPFPGVKQALVIAGSDPRGTAFGVFELSKMMGVQPFYWWADVTPLHKEQLFVDGRLLSEPPSVKYRGIFINDEDWGLQPWAAKTFEPETGDIGPKTYAKVFELLLRLKANLIWPAMHPSTKAFYHYPGNPQMATAYDIVVGSSHAEPMLRNNVGEWNGKTMGDFNYITNQEKVERYWEDRVQESKGQDVIYTLGMRGVHDGAIEGVKDAREAVPLLERIIADQRTLLRRHVAPDITAIPQAFTAYKEVLDIYDAGLRLPDDVTLVWPDDNYGYIQRLSDQKEQARSGRAGVYYHASYWGRPHDYLWLSSLHPSLMREEMMKAYESGSDRLWVLNVGDIKPLEYNIELFMDMAYNAEPFRNGRYTRKHLDGWAGRNFGINNSHSIGDILWEYYGLAFERKPEFMGWSQTEPTTQTRLTEYNHFAWGDEAQKRIDRYNQLEERVKGLRPAIDPARQDAFYQLVYYPAIGAALMNKKFLYRDKAVLYARQNRLSSLDYAAWSQAAYDSIVRETAYYNTRLAGGKWNGIMSMMPRDLPVYQAPVLPKILVNGAGKWNISAEGILPGDSLHADKEAAPARFDFDDIHKQKYFIDLFLSDSAAVTWTSEGSASWIRFTQNAGVLLPQKGKNQCRIWATVDWAHVPPYAQFSGRIVLQGAGNKFVVDIQGRKLRNVAPAHYTGFVENNRLVSMYAAHYSQQTARGAGQWQVLEGLGYAGSVLQYQPSVKQIEAGPVDTASVEKYSAMAAYDFYTFTAAPAGISIYTLPTHPLGRGYGMRYAVSVDDLPVKIIDFRTVGRSEEWKQNVLGNRAIRTMWVPFLQSGRHTLKIFSVDPGVLLDEIHIQLREAGKAYGTLPETTTNPR